LENRLTAVATELDFTVLEDLDFESSCDIEGHGGTDTSCDTGPAVWIAEATHPCIKKVRLICEGFKKAMEGYKSLDPELECNICNHLILFDDYFKVTGKL
jgi:hypothetical protein